jgi:hypothetical protein
VETLASESLILDLLKQRAQVLQAMQQQVQALRSNNVPNRASWERCKPERNVPLQRKSAWKVLVQQHNMAKYMTVQHSADGVPCVRMAPDTPMDLVPDETVPNYVDSDDWDPELSDSGFIGLYHQWYTCTGSTKPQLRLYFVCQTQCQKAGLEVRHLLNDVPHATPLASVAASEELWWLRNVNSRNRNRVILAVAQALGVPVPIAQDHHACHANTKMALPLTESLLSSTYEYRDGRIGVACDCMPTTFISNGAVCRMAPWEGVSIFSGVRTNTAFGGGKCPLAFACSCMLRTNACVRVHPNVST